MITILMNVYSCYCIYSSVEDDPFLKWSEPGIGRYLFMMSLVGTVGFTVLLIKEYKLLNKVSI